MRSIKSIHSIAGFPELLFIQHKGPWNSTSSGGDNFSQNTSHSGVILMVCTDQLWVQDGINISLVWNGQQFRNVAQRRQLEFMVSCGPFYLQVTSTLKTSLFVTLIVSLSLCLSHRLQRLIHTIELQCWGSAIWSSQ